jgi:hypothetical protein
MIDLSALFDGEHEILRLNKRMRLDGDVYDREVAYLSDHQVFHRFAKNGDWGLGWSYWKLWENLDEVYRIAEKKGGKGWTITYHPAYIPGIKELSRSARF